MKIPDEEMPQVLDAEDVSGMDSESLWVRLSDYKKLFNERRFTQVEECSPWISVEERLPEGDDLVCLVFTTIAEIGYCSGGAWFYGHWKPLIGVTHWMPLPKPPEEG